MYRNFIFAATTLVVFLIAVPQSQAQAQPNLKFSGLIFSDYEYTFTSPNGTNDGDNGFGFRRINFTTDFAISDRFDGRFRLEGSDGTATTNGKPALFVKDLYVRWKNAFADGHEIVFGVSGPPLWELSEKHWGYRGLEATIMDRGNHASSRDMGVTLRGPVSQSGTIQYGLMFANNSGGKAESDKFKRIYGQLEFYPSERLNATIGADYYHFVDGSSVAGNVFLGYSLDRSKLGVEAYFAPKTIDSVDDQDTTIGVSLFGSTDITEKQRLIARIDLLDRDNLGNESSNSWFIAGYSFRPEKGIEIIPNLIFNKNDSDDDPTITGRLTLIASF